MPQSLVYEFIDQLHAGTPLLKSLKRAIFQAKWDLGEEELERENGKEHFQIWKVKMRGLDDSDPVYVTFTYPFAFPLLLFSEHVLLFDALFAITNVHSFIFPAQHQSSLRFSYIY